MMPERSGGRGMRYSRRIAATAQYVVLACLGSLAADCLAGPVAAGDAGESVQQRIQASLKSLEPAGALGSVLSVTGAGKEPLTAEAGYADIERTGKITAHHLFQIGSQTKMFTAAALILLQEQGALDLDDLVAKYVEGTPRATELTIRQLLLHTGGIGDGIKYFDPPLGTRPEFQVTFDNHLFLGRVAGEKFAPGQGWEYNNLGFVILGRVVESASGISLDRFIRNSILQPLGMDDTYFGSLEEYPERRMAHGYFIDTKGGEIVDTTMPDLSWASSAGDMVSSPGDMRKWAQALLDEDNAIGISLGHFIADAVPVPDRGNLQQYGLGMMCLDVRGKPLWGHGGFIHGYVTLTLVEPSSGTIVQVMTNLGGESAEMISAVERVVADALELVQLASPEPLR
jgi:D-alanyl-D-alanine carboxypeptidase